MSLSSKVSGTDSTIFATEVWSGSEKTTSNPMTVTPSAVAFVIMSAMAVRGHGNWPSSSILRWSMSITATGVSGGVSRGFIT